MKKFSLILLSMDLFLCCNSFSQAPDFSWAKSFGGIYPDYVEAIISDQAGNIYFTGTSGSAANFFISKLDISGNLIWAKYIDGNGSLGSDGRAIAIDNFGNVYVTGNFTGTVDFDPGPGTYNLTSNPYDIFVSKYDSSGNFIWAKSMGGSTSDIGFSIAVDNAGNICLTGSFRGLVDFDPGPSEYNLTSYGTSAFVTQLDADGNFIWAKAIESTYGSDDCHSSSLKIDMSGNIYIIGDFDGIVDFDPGPDTFNLGYSGMGSHVFVLKLTASGDFVWVKNLTGSLSFGNGIALDSGNNIYVTGSFMHSVDFDPGPGTFFLDAGPTADVDIFICKLDSLGRFIWAKGIGGAGDAEGYSIALDSWNNVYTTGYYADNFSEPVDFDPGPGTFNLTNPGGWGTFISKLDNSGNFVWAKSMGGLNNDRGRSITIDRFDNAIIAGYFFSHSMDFGSITLTNAVDTNPCSSPDIFIAKLDAATGINGVKSNHEIMVFPNPAASQIIVSTNNKQGELILYDYLGKEVIRRRTNYEKEIMLDIISLSKGIYLLQFKTEKEMLTAKVLKE